jgi:hypothetical protein
VVPPLRLTRIPVSLTGGREYIEASDSKQASKQEIEVNSAKTAVDTSAAFGQPPSLLTGVSMSMLVIMNDLVGHSWELG